ncbi:MAG: PIN domain-containing protein [Nanoarchaeota archaeon]
MNIVVDTNIFISALIKDGVTRNLIVHSKYGLLFPELEFDEILEYEEEILKKSGLSHEEFEELLFDLLNYVKIIKTEQVIDYKDKATEIMGSIDEDDVIFIATALAFNCPVWSDDSHFKMQKKIKVIATRDMLES